MIDYISAITLAVQNMSASIDFYQRMGMTLTFGGSDADFSTLRSGGAFVNLASRESGSGTWWGRVIFRVLDVDSVYQNFLEQGLQPRKAPSDGPWGERYFHIKDPDGHDLSFATPLRQETERESGWVYRRGRSL